MKNINFLDRIMSLLPLLKENEELEFFGDGLIECWLSGCNAMYWNISNPKNIDIIKDFFKKLYEENEAFYSIEPWLTRDNSNEYEIKWKFSLEDNV